MRAPIGRTQDHIGVRSVSLGFSLLSVGTHMVPGRAKPASTEAGWWAQGVDIVWQ